MWNKGIWKESVVILMAEMYVQVTISPDIVPLSMQDKILIVKQMAERHHISGGELQRGHWYGQNAYADMLIENALFCDMYPDDVPNREDFHGFCRSNYFLSRAE